MVKSSLLAREQSCSVPLGSEGTLAIITTMVQKPGALSVNAEPWVFNSTTGREALKWWNACKHRLQCVVFESVTEYAFLLREILSAAAALRDRLLVCSSAAVSDFYTPHSLKSREKLRPKHIGAASEAAEDMALVKSYDHHSRTPAEDDTSTVLEEGQGIRPQDICHFELHQSYEHSSRLDRHLTKSKPSQLGSLQVKDVGFSLSLFPVPKFLFMIRDMAPCCFLVSFKLETTEAAVERGALAAMHSRHVDCVIGNTLAERNHKVVLFTRTDKKHINVETPDCRPLTVRRRNLQDLHGAQCCGKRVVEYGMCLECTANLPGVSQK